VGASRTPAGARFERCANGVRLSHIQDNLGVDRRTDPASEGNGD